MYLITTHNPNKALRVCPKVSYWAYQAYYHFGHSNNPPRNIEVDIHGNRLIKRSMFIYMFVCPSSKTTF